MHILLAIIGLVGGAAFWIYRLKMMGGAAKDAIGAAQTAKGFVTRRRLAAKSDFAAVTAIDSAPMAAAAWLRLQTDLFDWEDRRDAFDAFLTEAAGAEASQEALVYAEWLATQDIDPRRAVVTLGKMLNDWLDDGEMAALVRLSRGG